MKEEYDDMKRTSVILTKVAQEIKEDLAPIYCLGWYVGYSYSILFFRV